MAKKTIDSVDVSGKRVLVRVDFNVPIEDGVISDDRRIRMAIPTIQSVTSRGGRAVLMSHLGRPEGKGFEASSSLKPVAARLGELLGQTVQVPSNDCVDAASAAAVNALKNGAAILLENLRFHKAENKGDAAFAAKLAAYGDVYVNDAFGTCHREDASMVAVPAAMAGRPRVCGLLVQQELKYLSDAMRDPKRPFVVVMGGAKVSDKIPFIDHLLPKADAILVGGAMAYTFLKAMGKGVGTSRVETDRLAEAKRIIEQAATLKAALHLPLDHVCGTEFTEAGGDLEFFDGSIRDGYMGMDIGPRTQVQYSLIVRKAKTVVWNGPMGVFEWAPFKAGSFAIAQAMDSATQAGGTTIVGGGDTASAAEMFRIADRVSHVSTGGGASLEMLSGKAFKSVELLDNA